MEHLGLVDQVIGHLVGHQEHICAGFSGKGELPLAVGVPGDKGQGGKHGAVHQNAAAINAHLLQGLDQLTAQGIVAHLGDHGGLFAVLGQSGQKVGRCAAGMGGHDGIAVLLNAVHGKINQKFADGCYIIHWVFPPFFYLGSIILHGRPSEKKNFMGFAYIFRKALWK